MKKLFSLLLVALISSQMWGATLTFSTNNGTISATKGTSSVTSVTSGSSLSTWYDYTITVSSPTWEFEKWTVTYGSTSKDVTTSAVTNTLTFTPSTSGTSRILKFSTKSSPSNITIVAHFIDPSSVPATPATVLTAPPVVDLGSNVDVLWSTKNLGADNSTDAGYYYAWGEIEPKDSYVSTGYTSPYTTFGTANDVATQKLGSNWRMPTWSEVYQLVNYCTQTPSSTGLTISGNGASIFLPNTGYMDGTTKKNSNRLYLWTKTEHNTTNAKIIFAQNNAALTYTSSIYNTCYYGQPVRAVYVGPTATATFKNGTTTIKTQRVIPGTAPTAPANPTKDADEDYTYAFTGWSTSQNGSVAAIGNINSNTTYYAQFSATPKPVAKYTVTITSPEGGTGTLTVTAGGNTVNSGAELNKNTVITVTATPAEHYTGGAVVMQGETPVALTNNQFTLTGNVTISTNFTLRTYTIRFLMDDGETVIQSGNVAYGETPIAPADEDVTKIEDESYTYAFKGWDANNDGVVDEVAEVTGAQDYVAVFTATPIVVVPTYNITVGAYSNGTVTLTAGGDVQVVPAEGGVYNYLEGTTIIVKATANRGFHFTEWSDHTTNPSVRVREIDENKTFTPTFAANTPFTMYDTWDYDDCISNYNTTNTLTVVLDGRTFTADQWATLSVPFTTTLTADDALYNMVYRLSVATLSQDGGSMHFEFVRTNAIEANEPYLIVPRQAVNEVVFYGVKLETPVEKHPTTDNRVEFVSSLWKQIIHGRNEFYVGANSTLRYASTTGTTVKGNRAFFRKIGDAVTPAPRRIVISIDGVETTKVLTEDGELVDTTTKRMENGILIIERNSVRYDAQGNLID